MRYPGTRWAAFCPENDGLDCPHIPVNAGFHRTIPAIAHPAVEAQSGRRLCQGSAISDALYTSFYDQVLTHKLRAGERRPEDANGKFCPNEE